MGGASRFPRTRLGSGRRAGLAPHGDGDKWAQPSRGQASRLRPGDRGRGFKSRQGLSGVPVAQSGRAGEGAALTLRAFLASRAQVPLERHGLVPAPRVVPLHAALVTGVISRLLLPGEDRDSRFVIPGRMREGLYGVRSFSGRLSVRTHPDPTIRVRTIKHLLACVNVNRNAPACMPLKFVR